MACSAGEDVDADGYSPVGTLEELQTSGRKRVSLNERVVVIFYASGELYALDHFCYRELHAS